jgi:pyruvate/2-oxoglutarate/acetoin dehydrogenase E1 component
VFIYGQDVGSFGGAFKATKNLAVEFPGRVLDSPISEDAMVGMAVGAAIEGMRPIIEMQFADFSLVGFNQIVNQAATLFWRTNVPCPITVRLPFGGTSGSGPFHSQCIEAIYAHYPGLIVLTPATVEDAYSMLLEAVALDDPVIFCEHKFLYYHLKAEKLPEEALPIGKARIAREGRDLTVVTYSAMVHEALEAAKELSGEGWEIEIVDLRSVKPLDTDTIVASVARTGQTPLRRRSLAVGWRHRGNRFARHGGRFRPARRPAATPQRQRHSRALSSESLGRASSHRPQRRRRRQKSFKTMNLNHQAGKARK